jgi:hypothetical protein
VQTEQQHKDFIDTNRRFAGVRSMPGLLLLLVMLVLFFPIFQECTNLFKVMPLNGAYESHVKPKLNFHNWWEGTYQDSFELSHNEQFGLRNIFVRVHNQLEYDLFDRAMTNGVIVGKQNYLFEYSYIKSYNGEDFIGDSAVLQMTRKIKTLQDTLAKKNITLIIAFAPGKASFYPEYIPDEMNRKSEKTNFKFFSKSFPEYGVNFINFGQWIYDSKKSSPYPLFPNTGIHWSRYACALVIDSLVSYIETQRHIDLPSMKIRNYVLTDSVRVPDNDIGSAMNLLFPIRPLTMAYPDYSFENATDKTKVRIMIIADSFGWNIVTPPVPTAAFSGIDFWYYNKQHSTFGETNHEEKNSNSLEQTEQENVIMVLATETNLSRIGWNYIDDAYEFYVLKHKEGISKAIEIRNTIDKINASPDWLKLEDQKAIERNIGLDSMIHIDALYIYDQEHKK